MYLYLIFQNSLHYFPLLTRLYPSSLYSLLLNIKHIIDYVFELLFVCVLPKKFVYK